MAGWALTGRASAVRKGPRVSISTASVSFLILRRDLLDVIEDEHFHRSFGRLQPQPELFLDPCGEPARVAAFPFVGLYGEIKAPSHSTPVINLATQSPHNPIPTTLTTTTF